MPPVSEMEDGSGPDEAKKFKKLIKQWKSDFQKANGKPPERNDYTDEVNEWVRLYRRSTKEPAMKGAPLRQQQSSVSLEIAKDQQRGQSWQPPQNEEPQNQAPQEQDQEQREEQQQQQQQQQPPPPQSPSRLNSAPAGSQSYTHLELSPNYKRNASISTPNSGRVSIGSSNSSKKLAMKRAQSMRVPDSEMKANKHHSFYQASTKEVLGKTTKPFHGDAEESIKEIDILFSSDKGSLDDIIERKEMPLPQALNYPENRDPEGRNKLLFVYTDLEPDDIFAILCHVKMLLPDLAKPPLIVWTTQFLDEKDERDEKGRKKTGKDGSGIYVKKKLLATTALGMKLVNGMIEVADVAQEHERLEKSPAKKSIKDDGMQRAANELHNWATTMVKCDLEVLIMAPGRGHLGILQKCLDKLEQGNEAWPNLLRGSTVRLYSGTFNMKGMTEKDIGFIKKTTKLSGNPLVDVAHFLYTGKSQGGLGEDGKQLSNLSFLCPQLGKRIEEVNPFLGASWKKYSELFNLKILDPSNPKFVGEMLQEKAEALEFLKTKELEVWTDAIMAGRSDDEEVKSINKRLKKLDKKKYEEVGVKWKDKRQALLTSVEADVKHWSEKLDILNKEFEAVKLSHKHDSFWTYANRLHESPLKDEIGFKKRIVNSLTEIGYHESPLCDCLVYLHCWLENNSKLSEKIDMNVKGFWWYDLEKGYSGVVDKPDGAVESDIQAISPRLKDFNDVDLADKMARHLEDTIVEAVHLHMRREPIMSDIFKEELDEKWTRNFFENHKQLWRSVCDKQTGKIQINAFKQVLDEVKKNQGVASGYGIDAQLQSRQSTRWCFSGRTSPKVQHGHEQESLTKIRKYNLWKKYRPFIELLSKDEDYHVGGEGEVPKTFEYIFPLIDILDQDAKAGFSKWST